MPDTDRARGEVRVGAVTDRELIELYIEKVAAINRSERLGNYITADLIAERADLLAAELRHRGYSLDIADLKARL